MRECVYREGKKAKSTVQEDAGMPEEIQGGNAEADEKPGDRERWKRAKVQKFAVLLGHPTVVLCSLCAFFFFIGFISRLHCVRLL